MIDRLEQSYFISHKEAIGYTMSGYPIYHFATGRDAVTTARMILHDLQPDALRRLVEAGPGKRNIFGRGTWTRSNGSPASRVYERLTKRSRRRQVQGLASLYDQGYRQGVYDAFKALQEELTN